MPGAEPKENQIAGVRKVEVQLSVFELRPPPCGVTEDGFSGARPEVASQDCPQHASPEDVPDALLGAPKPVGPGELRRVKCPLEIIECPEVTGHIEPPK